DPTLLSKIERDERMPTRAQINALADLFKEQKKEIFTAWLSDKIVDLLQGEEMAREAMKVAEAKISYGTLPETEKRTTIRAIREILRKDKRVTAAWLFGSMARGEAKAKSDV